MTTPSQPSEASVPNDAAASITGTVVGDAPSADVVRPPAIDPAEDDPTDAESSLTGVLFDDATAEPDDDTGSEVDTVSE